jgi:hypothetical protein
MLMETAGRWLARYLVKPGRRGARGPGCKPPQLAATLRRGDVLLVEGASRISTAIKYLTQSTWSHAALFVGRHPDPDYKGEEADFLVEVDVIAGVRLVRLDLYADKPTRICRPVGLSPREIDGTVAYAVSRLGHTYDLKNIVDLARYVIQTPPVPTRWRRRMLALGSGDPTQAICSSLIAQAFQSVGYPILPEVVLEKSGDPACRDCYEELMHIRHHSLFTPSDFDLSPYFQVIKPTLEEGFDPHRFPWAARAVTGNGQQD